MILKYFLPVCGGLFLTVFFEEQMSLILRGSAYQSFLLLLVLLVLYLKYHGLIQNLRFIPMFSSKSPVVSTFTFKSMTHFELNFVYCVR